MTELVDFRFDEVVRGNGATGVADADADTAVIERMADRLDGSSG